MKNGKKLGLLLAGIAVIAGVVLVVIIGTREPGQSVKQDEFALSEETYGEAGFLDITAEEFDELVAEKKSFIVILHMTVCPAEFPIRDVAKRLAHEKELTIYGLKEDEFRKTALADTVKFLPSAAIYHDGELVDELDAEADEDLEYYKTVEGLEEWLRKNGVKL